ncbi:RNA polymerase sigma factor [Chryseobacterium shigense]|uniref:RNA polymerase sigma-70 factor (ECF subfamily) n=1 Tax=Chryseobacterium shigense TaxID=297244 RepID=A0A841N963_9FLAO|nr:sigma-70 family RNA polymerase sigma factor [Chryseobacterium shigense]MBB6371231.1 RNA polymerase sigma-70 factor (ECF subfamily) [Chryseobacterium shigense]
MESLFEELYSKYKHQVYFFVKKYIHGQEDIEDVVQDIFVHVWKHRDSLSKNAEAIVFKTAKQEIANFFRKNRLSFVDLKENAVLDFEKEDYDEDEQLLRSEEIKNLLHLIPEKSKDYFLKHKVDGLSYSQIAKENNISKNAVAKHVNKVLQLLKARLNIFFF